MSEARRRSDQHGIDTLLPFPATWQTESSMEFAGIRT